MFRLSTFIINDLCCTYKNDNFKANIKAILKGLKIYIKQDGFALIIQLGRVLGGVGRVVGNVLTTFIQLTVAGSISNVKQIKYNFSTNRFSILNNSN